MREDYAHISIILDRTGSMESIRDDTIGGFNAFLKEQKNRPGTATLTLVQFDTQDPYEVIHDFTPIKDVPGLTRETYVPRASTPLLDAMGRGINDLEKRLRRLTEEERPGKVVMVIITDGQENSSREFSKDQVEKMIKEHEEKDGWQSVFLSADLSAIGDALDYGFQQRKAMMFDKSSRGTARVWASVSQKISEYREGAADEVSFSDEARQEQGEQEDISGK
ncbi:MAG: vWA domain-containing protein [PVC group bacterium]